MVSRHQKNGSRLILASNERLQERETVREELMREQKGLCAICETPQDAAKRRFAIDHCHKSGKVRGILCSNCNSALGMFKDSIPMMKRAITYLCQPTDGRPLFIR